MPLIFFFCAFLKCGKFEMGCFAFRPLNLRSMYLILIKFLFEFLRYTFKNSEITLLSAELRGKVEDAGLNLGVQRSGKDEN